MAVHRLVELYFRCRPASFSFARLPLCKRGSFFFFVASAGSFLLCSSAVLMRGCLFNVISEIMRMIVVLICVIHYIL